MLAVVVTPVDPQTRAPLPDRQSGRLIELPGRGRVPRILSAAGRRLVISDARGGRFAFDLDRQELVEAGADVRGDQRPL